MSRYLLQYVTPEKPKAGMVVDGLVLQSMTEGTPGNDLRYSHQTGPTGVGNEDRALASAVLGDDITVTFGTDSSGDTIIPTPAQIIAVLPASITAFSNDGSISTFSLANLSGGTESQTMRNIDGSYNIRVKNAGRKLVSALVPGDEVAVHGGPNPDWAEILTSVVI